MSARYIVGRVSDLPDGERLIVDIGGRSIGVFHVGGEFYALRNRCPHAGGELCRGRVVGRLDSDRPGRYVHDLARPLVACPWHGWEFELATGQSYIDPRRTRVRAYDVEVAPGGGLIDGAGEPVPGPYRAETVPISVDDDYLVVTLGA
jgi:3-phenylpropionate/trans-cinnamate dioxygenase ferredoxin subunit